MKLVTYHSPTGLRPGVLVGDVIVDVQSLAGDDAARHRSVKEILTGGPDGLAAFEKRLAEAGPNHVAGSVGGLHLAPPVPDPDKILCVGLNYKEHVDEVEREIPPYPTLFAKFSNSPVGPHDPVRIPPIADPRVDYEGELAVVIGRPASRLRSVEALNFVAGVTVLNDVTSRRLQNETTQWLLGKAVDDFAPIGPALVTLDEIADIQDLRLRTRVNGEVVQSSSTGAMIWTVAELLAIITETIALQPGDIVATGTPAGIGARRTPPLFLVDGDVVEVEIEAVGTIRNTMTSS
jgi:2-keto-4-pentenoate hydratase/2-oxohepta-3-ene-1,7-dioic acid hydratase in catechol pathway